MLRRVKKVIALITVIMMLYASSSVVISAGVDEVLSLKDLERQEKRINDNISFDVCNFQDGHYSVIDIQGSDKLYVKINVQNGILQDSVLKITDSNLKITNVEGDVEEFNNNSVTFGQITGEKNIALVVVPDIKDVVSSDFFVKQNNFELSGVFVNSNNKESQVKGSIKVQENINSYEQTEQQTDSLEDRYSFNEEIEKIITYKDKEIDKVLVEQKITTTQTNSLLPQKSEEIKTSIPKIENIMPETIKVFARTPLLDAKNEFKELETEIDEDTNSLSFKVEAEEGKDIVWPKNESNEYRIFLIYPQNVYNIIKDLHTVNITSRSNITVRYFVNYGVNGLTFSNEKNHEVLVNNEKENVIDSKVTIPESIDKGYLYDDNFASSANHETSYKETYEMFIPGIIEDQVELRIDDNKFVAGDQSFNANSIIKSIKLNNIETIKKLVGEEGKLTILSQNTVLKTIDKNSEETEFDLSQYNAKDITIKINNPKFATLLKVELERTIKGTQSYTNEQVEAFEKIKTNAKEVATIGEKVILTEINESEATLLNSEYNASIDIKNLLDESNNLSTIMNNNVEINAVLETESIKDRLYNNPVLEIELPNNTEVVSTKLLFNEGTGLSLGNVSVDGNKLIVQINGTQIDYSNSQVKGPTIQIIANITPEITTPSKTEYLTLNVKENDNIIKTANRVFNYVAEPGLVTINKMVISENEITAIKENKQAILPVSNELNATVKGQIINNIGNNASDVKVLAKIPTKDIDGNTFTQILKGAVRVENATVYYTTNSNASKDINNEANAWTLEVSNYNEIKAILIVVNGDLAQGSILSFEYDISIPALLYNNTDKSSYEVNYSDKSESENKVFVKNSQQIILTTGKGPELNIDIETSADQNNGKVKQGQIVNVKAKVKNTGTEKATNVVVNLSVPEGAKLVQYNETKGMFEEAGTLVRDLYEDEEAQNTEVYDSVDNQPYNDFNIGDLNVGESIEKEFTIMINQDAQTNANIIIKAISEEITQQKNKILEVENAELRVINRYYIGESQRVVKESESVGLILEIENVSGRDITNDIKLKYFIPKDFEIQAVGLVDIEQLGLSENDENFKVNDGVITYTYKETLEKDSLIRVMIIGRATKSNIDTYAIVNDDYYSNKLHCDVETISYEFKAISKDEQEILNGEKALYEFEVKNTGNVTIDVNKFSLKLSDTLIFDEADIILNDDESIITLLSDDGEIETKGFLQPGEIINIKVYAKTKELTEEEIANKVEKQGKATLTYEYNEYEDESISLTYYILPQDKNDPIEEPDDPTNPIDEPVEDTTYRVSGAIWFDENKNGKRDENEKIFSDVKVLLINSKDANVVKDKDDQKEKITVTDSKGEYYFDNLPKGNYIVVFLYNDASYIVTTYQKEEVSSAENSDAISKVVLYEGEEYKAAMTDTLKITDSNLRNIDLGLTKADKFGLELTKKIGKVTVTTPDGSSTYDYTDNEKQISKVEIKDKYLNASSIVVEYKISVTNNGNIAGYAKKIVDYLPAELKFNSELNPNWYLGIDGNAYSNELANTEIKPGETKEITLILTKTMTSENTGVYANSAKIAETYNVEGLDNKSDSSSDNSSSSATDKTTANMAVTVKTGEPVIYTEIALIVIVILGLGAYEIKKHVISPEERG